MKIWKWLTAREHRLVFCGILAALVATVAYAGVIVHGQLVDASLENLSSDPTSHSGRVYFNTSTNQPKIYNGSAWTGLGSGAGSGEKNYLASGSSSATGWTASDAGVTCSTPTTNLPDPSLSTALGVTGASGSTAFCYATFTLDDADFNKKMKLAFDQFAVSGYVASDMRVDVCSCGSAFSGGACSSGTVAQGCGTNATRLALSTDSSAVSALPALTGTYRTTWDSPGSSQKYIQVQVGLNGSNTHQLNLANIVAGPGVVTQGAAVSGWTSYTPTVVGNTTSANAAQWRRVGDTMQVQGYLTASNTTTVTLTVTLPSGYTINTAALGKGGALDDVLGYGTVDGSSFTTLNVMYGNSTAVQFARTGASNVINASNTIVSGNVLDYGFTVPINEWSGAGTVNVVQNDCEYAYNTGNVTGAGLTDSSSFAYGPAGTSFLSYNSATTSASWTAFQVQWKTPISVTDKNGLEINDGNDWIDSATILPWIAQGTSRYGMRLESIDSKTLQVDFGNAGALPTNAGYAGTGTAWSVLITYKWRVKKCAGGQAVGFAAANTTSSGLVSYEDSGTFSATFTGPRTTAAKTITYARVGKLVTLSIPSDTGVTCSAATAAFNANGSIPSALRPTGQREFLLVGIQDNATTQSTPGDVLVDSSGDLQIYKTNSGTTFTTSASCGWQATAITYTVN